MEDLNEIDKLFSEGLKNARVTPPAGAWESIASSAGTSAGASGTAGSWLLAGKWVAAIVAVGSAAYGILQLTNQKTEVAMSPQEIVTSVNAADQSNAVESQSNMANQSVENTGTGVNATSENSASYPATDNQNAEVPFNPKNPEINSAPLIQPVKKDSSRSLISNKTESQISQNNKTAASPCVHRMQLQAQKITNTAYSFIAINPIGEVMWKFGDGSETGGYQLSHVFPSVPGQYKVRAYSSSAETGCKDSAFHSVLVEGPKPELMNIFTPNGDGLNDAYYVVVQHVEYFEMNIIDATGQRVFHSTNPSDKWDGSCFNKPCPAGKYRVALVYRYPGETKVSTLSEIVTLNR